MSRDIFVQDIPDAAESVADIPDDFVPRPLDVNPNGVRALISELVPGASFRPDGRGVIEEPGVDIEVLVSDDEPFYSFAFVDRSVVRAEADKVVSRILGRLEVRAFDIDSPTGIFRPIM